MANDKKFQVKNGLRTQNINFQDNPEATNIITTSMIDDLDALSISGDAGQLFSLTDDLTGSVFTVNDISGMPSIEVLANGNILLAEYEGKVGIGTNSPASKLHISGNSDTSDEDVMLIIEDVDGTSGSRVPAIMFRSNIGGTVTNQARIRGTDTQGIVMSGSASLGEDLVVQAGGVGVGTASPSRKLDVRGSVRFSVNTSTHETFTFTTQGVDEAKQVMKNASSVDTIILNTNGNTYFNGGNVGIGTTTPASTLDLTNGTDTAERAIRIQNDTVVLLTGVEGSAGNRFVGSAVGNAFFGTTSAHGLELGTNNNVRMVIDSAGNVGIGVSSPNHKLEIRNDVAATTDLDPTSIKLYNNSDGGSAIEFSNAVLGKSKISFGVESTGAGTNDSYLGFSTGQDGALTERMRINPDGKTDVGGIPNQTVAVLNARFNGAALEFGHGNNSAGYYGTAGSYGNNGQPYIGFSCYAQENLNLFTTNGAKGNIITGDLSGNLTFAQVTTATAVDQTPENRMTLLADGKFGIGITGPTSLLHVQSNDATINTFVDMLTLTALSTGITTIGFGPAIKFQAERNNGVMQNVGRIRSVAEINSGTDISSGLAFETSTVGVAEEKVRISYDGKILIGDTASHTDDLLQIETPASGGGHGIQIRRNDSNADQLVGHIQFGNNTATDLASISAKTDGATDDGALLFNTSVSGGANTERMRIDGSGNLLVATTDTTPYNNTSGGGFVVASSGLTSIARETTASNQAVLHLNNTGVDGILAEFAKDGAPIGSIGSEGGDSLYIEGGTTAGSGLHFHGTTSDITPLRNGARIDNVIDLGSSSNRFKDLYLSNAVYANQLTVNQPKPYTPAHFKAIGGGSGPTDVLTIETYRSDVGDDFTGGSIVFVNSDTNSAGQARIKVGSANDAAPIGLDNESIQSFIFETSTQGTATTSNIDGNATTITVTHTAASLVVGQRIAITAGTYQGSYTIDTVLSSTQFTIADTAHNLAADTTSRTLQYGIPRDSMIIRADGNVGIGTNSPTANITIDNGLGGSGVTTFTTANSYLQLGVSDYNTSGAVYAIGFGYTNGGATHSPAYIGLQQTGTGTFTNGDLVFRTRSTTTDVEPPERMRIDGSGNVGIGGSPTAPLHVFGGGILGSSSTNPIAFTGSGGANAGIGSYNANTDFCVYSAGTGSIRFRTAATWNSAAQLTSIGTDQMQLTSGGNLIVAGNITAYGSPSDIRLKENIEVIPNAVDKVKTLDGITFNYIKDGADKRMTGVIAQQVQEVLPEAVYETETIEDPEDKNLAVHYGNMVGLLIEAIKEQQQQIDELKSIIEGM